MLLDLIRRARSFAVPAAAALIAGTIAAVGANTPLFSPSIGDVIFRGPLGGNYVKNVPLTGATLTADPNQNSLLLRPAGTILATYINLAPSPVPDGRELCVFSTQIITFLYLTAGTGQTLNNAVTTLAANGKVCYLYSLSNLTWDRSQ